MNVTCVPFSRSNEDIQKYLEIEKRIDTPYAEVTTSAEEARAELDGMDANFVYADDKLVGFVAHQEKHENGERFGYIWEIVLLPEFRGKGIGEQVMRVVLEKYAQLAKVSLRVDPENAPALMLYQKLGFEVEKQIENATDTGRPRLLMSRLNQKDRN